MYYTYILQSRKDGKWYTGATSDLRKRLNQHNSGQVRATKGRGPFGLIYYEACLNEQDAFAREKYLKSGVGKRYLKNRLRRFLSLTGRVPLKIKKDGVYPVRGRSPLATVSSNGGFVALMSSIIISMILVLIAVTLGSDQFYGRYNILDSELKERSSALADACFDTAMLKLTIDQNYNPLNETVTVGADTCNILRIDPPPSAVDRIIYIQAKYADKYYTNLEITVDTTNLSIKKWEEVPTL